MATTEMLFGDHPSEGSSDLQLTSPKHLLSLPLKLIDQNFSDILEYRCNLPPILDVEISAKPKTQDLQIFGIDYSASESSRDRTRAVMQLSGTLYVNSAGIILGMLR